MAIALLLIGFFAVSFWKMFIPVELGSVNIDHEREIIFVTDSGDSFQDMVSVMLEVNGYPSDEILLAYVTENRRSINDRIQLTSQNESSVIVSVDGIPNAKFLVNLDNNTLSPWSH